MSRRVPLAVLLVLVSSTALADRDGGSSSILFQAAATLLTLLFLRRSWGRIQALFGGTDPAPPPEPGPLGADVWPVARDAGR